MELRGNSRITGSRAAAGAQAMSARDIDLTYARRRPHAADGAADGERGRAAAPAAGQARRRIAGKTIDIDAWRPTARRSPPRRQPRTSQLDLPAEGDAPARAIRSASLIAGGAPSGLADGHLRGRRRLSRDPPAPARRPAADRPDGAVAAARSSRRKPGFGDIEQARLPRQRALHRRRQTVADAPRAIYQVAQDSFDLTPVAGRPGPAAVVTTAGCTSTRARSTSRSARSKLKADTRRAQLDAADAARSRRTGAARRPGAPARRRTQRSCRRCSSRISR